MTGTGDRIDGFDGAGISFTFETEDKIDLRAIDANTATAADDDFTFLGELTDAQGQVAGPGVLWVHNDGDSNITFLHGNIDVDNSIELTIRIADGAGTVAEDYWGGDFFL